MKNNTPNIKWRVAIKGNSRFVGSKAEKKLIIKEGSFFKHKLCAIDIYTGKKIWQSERSFRDSRILTKKNIAIVLDNISRIFGFNLENGHILWEFDTDLDISSKHYIVDDKVIFSDRGYIYFLNIFSGEIFLKLKYDWSIVACPIIEREIMYVFSWAGNLYSINLESGNIEWSYKTGEGHHRESELINHNNSIIFRTHANIYSVYKNSGKLKWNFQFYDDLTEQTFIKAKNKVFAGRHDGYMYAFNSDNGELEWEFKTGRNSSSINSCVSLKTGQIIITNTASNIIYSVDLESGQIIWKKKTSNTINTVPIIKEKNVIVGVYGQRDSYINCFNLKDGTRNWEFITEGSLTTNPFILDNILFLLSYDDHPNHGRGHLAAIYYNNYHLHNISKVNIKLENGNQYEVSSRWNPLLLSFIDAYKKYIRGESQKKIVFYLHTKEENNAIVVSLDKIKMVMISSKK